MEALSYWERKLAFKSPNTKREYRRYFSRFLDRFDLTPEALYEMQRAALGAEDPRDADAVADLVRNFMREMADEGYSNSTCNMVLKSLKSFFDANKLDFKVKDLRLRRISNGQRRIRRDQVLEVYRYCQRDQKLRNRALVLAALNSGLRVSDLSQLNVEQYLGTEDFESGGEVFKIFKPFPTVKTGDLAHTVLGPEAIEALDAYIGAREAGPLFLDESGERMGVGALTAQFVRLSKTLGKAGEDVTAHSYRKAFKTAMETAMPENWVKLLMGKSVGPYSKPDAIDLAEKYAEGYDRLRIFKTGATAVEVEELRTRIAELEAERDGLGARLGKRMEGFEKQIEQLRRWRAMSEENKADLVEVEPGTWIDKDLVEGWRKRRRLSAIKKAKA